MMPVGRGRLDVGAILRGDFSSGAAGGRVHYEHRLTAADSLYAQAMAALGWGELAGLHYEATAGWRHTFR
jgi:hypothetical protein